MPQPAAFLSYVHSDDKYKKVSELREYLSDEVRTQTGHPFPIFQDRNDIAWGQNWQERLDQAIGAEVTFFIPIITPSFFNSAACCSELTAFLKREKKLRRNDLILPIYYVECPLLHDDEKLKDNPLAAAIASRQYADWRELRFEPFTSPQSGKSLANLAKQIRLALERVQTPIKAPVKPQRSKTRQTPPAPAIETKSQGTTDEQEAQIRKPSAKTETPTHIVSQMHRGDFVTITEAIAKAKPGDRILVQPGIYEEGIVIDKPLEIIGDGKLEDITVQVTGENIVLFKTTMGRISNLTFRQLGGRFFALDIAQGRLELEGCDISSQGLSCVSIHAGADPRVRGNRIHNGKQSGIYVYENGQGTIEDNDIYDNTLSCVAIRTGANPTIRNNRIHNGKASGIYLYENGQGTIEDNDIYTNELSGIEVKTGANPIIRNNRIHDGKASGIFVHENGQGTIEDNDIYTNELSGITIKTGANPAIRSNRIHDGKQNGVMIYENGQGTIENNDIYANTYSAIEIRIGANPIIRNNRIHDGKRNGIYIHTNGQGIIEDNDIYGNAKAGIAIKTSANPTIRNNRINKNSGRGIYISQKGSGIIEDNDLSGNDQGAWSISEDSITNVKRARNKEE